MPDIPGGDDGGIPSGDTVATIVQQTLEALTPGGAGPGPVEATEPPPASLLPQALYFMGTDVSGLDQVFRLAADGMTLTQVTFEPANVQSFDISPVDGSVAYVSNNQLLVAAADGSGRRLLVDGGDAQYEFNLTILNPRWSPDGWQIAYGLGGLNFYGLNTGFTTTALTNNIDIMGAGFPIVREGYSPYDYSPDGTKLLVNVHWYEGSTLGVYHPASGSFVQASYPGILCCTANWAPDGSTVHIASPALGLIESGLWRMDPASGMVTTLIPSSDGLTYNFADAPLLGPDGQLYFFFSNLPTIPEGHTPLNMVRSAPDGVTGRALLSDVIPSMNEALWASDASLAVVAISTLGGDYEWQGGALMLYYPDGRPLLALGVAGQSLRWGP